MLFRRTHDDDESTPARKAFPLLLASLLLLVTFSAHGLDVPRLKGRVNDHAGLLSPEQASRIENALAQHEAATSNQIALLTVPSLEGEDLEGFSIRVAEAWKLGQKGKDNGVILLVARDERKMRIEVGYGLEGALTDVESSQIIRNVVVPLFRSGDYYAGIASGLQAIVSAIEGEFSGEGGAVGMARGRRSPGGGLSSLLFYLLILVFSGGSFFMRRGRRGGMLLPAMFLLGGGRRGRGGGFGGGGFGGGGFGGGGGGFGGGGSSGGW